VGVFSGVWVEPALRVADRDALSCAAKWAYRAIV